MRTLLALAFLSTLAPLRAEAKTEVFVVKPNNYIAATVAPGGFLAAFPAGIPLLSEPAIQNGLLLIAKLQNAVGAIVGFASEQAVLDVATAVSHSTWTLTVPGRGTLFLSQQETLAPLLQFISEMIASGQLDRTWDPPYVLTTTVNSTGKVMGGTGEFAHARGSFREVDSLHHISLLTGVLEVTDTLIVDLKTDGDGDAQ